MSRERHPQDPGSPWWGEHLFRYEEVLRRMEGERPRASTAVGDAGRGTILDAACGTGFGSRLLARRAGVFVTGLDIAVGPLVEAAGAEPSTPPLVAGDVSSLPLADASVDVVTSFETLEHTPRYRAALDEFARVLRPGGTLFLSTPNRPVQSPRGVENPFHVQEFDRDELRRLLEERFEAVEVSGQAYTRWEGRGRLRRTAGRALEALLHLRGVRKLPLPLQDALMRGVGAPGVYPTSAEFRVAAEESVVDRCRTLFAVAGKRG